MDVIQRIKSWLFPITDDYQIAMKKAHIKFYSMKYVGEPFHHLMIGLYHKPNLRKPKQFMNKNKSPVYKSEFEDYLYLIDKLSHHLKHWKFEYILHGFGGITIKEE